MPNIGTDLYLAYENGYEAGKTDATQKWISVKERLPEPRFSREWYLVSLESGSVMTLAFERADNRWAMTDSPVAYWMPLPEPPKEGGGEDGV